MMPHGQRPRPLVRRNTARLLVLDPQDRVLLFRFTPETKPPFWATPGGAVDAGESFAEAGQRELFEETGFIAAVGEAIAIQNNRYFAFWGEDIIAQEHYFAVRTGGGDIDISGHEEIERQVMTAHRWFSHAELACWSEPVYPENILELLAALRI